MKTKYLLSFFFALFLAVSCEEPVIPEVKAELSVNGVSNLQNVVADANSITATVVTNVNWTITPGKEDWLSIDKLSGVAGETKVTISIQANTAEESRRSSFKVAAGDKEEDFTIIQAAAEKEPEPDPAVITLTGKEQNQVSNLAQDLDFTVKANYDWTIESTNLEWASITPTSGEKDKDVSVKVSISANTVEQPRTGSFTIKAKEASKTVEISQEAFVPDPTKYDSHAVGYVFFQDDFVWVANTWDATYPKYGWISAKTDGSHNNEYAVNTVAAAKAEADRIGYVCDACCYAKAEGYLKLGKSAQIGSIITPALSGIDAESVATLDLSFNAGLYCSAAKVSDTYTYIQVGIEGEGKIASCGTDAAIIATDGKSVQIPLLADDEHIWRWTKKHIAIQGADATTKIKFGSSDAQQGRCFLDDVCIARASDTALSPAKDEIIIPALDYAASLNGDGAVGAAGGSISASLRVNRDFEVRSDASWLTITQIAYATSSTAVNKDGVEIAENGLTATVCRTAMPYNQTTFTAAANESTSTRTGHIAVYAEGNAIATLTVTQAAADSKTKCLAKWSWTGLVASGDLADVATDWISGNHKYASDAVEGGVFTALAQGTQAAYSVGTATQKKDRLRINKMSVNDWFQFSVESVSASAGDVIQLSGVGIATTAITTGPVNWTEEYSLDGGETWTALKTINITSGSTPFDMGCEITLASAISGAKVCIRVRIADNSTSSGTFVDGQSNIAMVMLNADDKVTSNNTHYTDDWAYAVINLVKQ